MDSRINSKCPEFSLTVVIPVDEDLASDPLRGINVEAAGGAGKVLRMLAEKVSLRQARTQEMYEVAYAAGRPFVDKSRADASCRDHTSAGQTDGREEGRSNCEAEGGAASM